MPHQCTTCGHVFADGSKEMLSGCPDCGGTKFQFHPDGADISDKPPGDAQPPERPDAGESVAGTVGKAAETVRNLVGSGAAPTEDGLTPTGTESSTADTPTATGETDSSPATADSGVAGVTLNERETSTAEDAAQASARSDVVSPEELSESETGDPPSDGRIADTPEEDSPDLSELREELNDQFESIKVLEPGQYELNLMELYDREEYIIALQEDGKYSIQVPDRWQD